MRDFFDWLRTADPNSRKKAVLLISLGSALTLVSVLAIWYILKARTSILPMETHQEVESKTSDHSQGQGTSAYTFPYEINQVSMALMNRKGTQTAYAQFSLILDCPSEESKKLLTMNRAKLLDTIFVVGSGFYLDDFKGSEATKGFEKFKTQLLQKYQGEFQAQAPKEISLKDWIVN